MKTKTSFMQLAKNMSTVGLLFSISKAGVEAASTSAAVETEAQSDAQLHSLAVSMQKAMMEQGIDAGSTSELQSLIKQHVESQLSESMHAEQSQKTNLEESMLVDLQQDVSTPRSHNVLISFHFVLIIIILTFYFTEERQ